MSSGEILIYSFTLNQEFIFKAYVTSFSDSFASNWKTENVFGKMDPIATFQNTSRKITMELDVPSTDFFEARNNFIKVSQLISGLYPVYDNTNKKGIATISSPPLFRIKYANLVSNNSDNGGLLCYFDSGFTFNPDFTAGVFNTSTEIYPKLFKASLGFTVLHEQPLGRNANHNSRLAEGKTFPYNLDNLDKENFNIKKFRKDFEAKDGQLADYIKQIEEQSFAAAVLRKELNGSTGPVPRTSTEETPPSNKIEAEILKARRNATGERGRDAILARPVAFNEESETFFFESKENTSLVLQKNPEEAKRLQAKLYEYVRANKKIKGAVFTGSDKTSDFEVQIP